MEGDKGKVLAGIKRRFHLSLHLVGFAGSGWPVKDQVVRGAQRRCRSGLGFLFEVGSRSVSWRRVAADDLRQDGFRWADQRTYGQFVVVNLAGVLHFQPLA